MEVVYKVKLTEKCKGWTGEFDIEGLPELSDKEKKVVKSVIHSAGDVISSMSALPEGITPELRETIIGTIGLIMTEAKNNAILALDSFLSQEAMNSPLENEFSTDNLFGVDLKEELIKNIDEKELNIALEHYPDLVPRENDQDQDPREEA